MIREEDLEKLCEVWFKVMEFTIIVSILTYLSQQHFSFRIDFAVSILKFASYILLNIYILYIYI